MESDFPDDDDDIVVQCDDFETKCFHVGGMLYNDITSVQCKKRPI